MMGDGKALQMGTSHELGQNFAKVFETQYSSESGSLEYVWQTSWGSSTRMVGGLIMCHGDDAGLRVPPRLAPIQVVVLLIRGEDGAGEAAERLARELKGVDVRTEIDTRTDVSFGRRVVDWELKGIPVRVEVGPRDLASGVVTLARRDSGAKDTVPVAEAAPRVLSLLEHIQGELLAEATGRLESRTASVDTVDEAVEAAADGFARLPWSAVGAEGEDRMRADGVTVRCLRREDGSLPLDDAEPGLLATVGRAY
jgi:prolyl-tRNA synthetase